MGGGLGLCPGGGLCAGGSPSRRVSVHGVLGGLCTGGLCLGGLSPVESLSGDLCLRGSLSEGGLCPGGVCLGGGAQGGVSLECIIV